MVVGPFGVQIVVAVDLVVVEVHFVEQTVAWMLAGEQTVRIVGEWFEAVSCFVGRIGAGQRLVECKGKG